MPDLDLAEQLRAYTDALVPATPTRRRPPRRRWVLAVAAAVLVALVGVGVLARDDDDDASVVAVPGTTEPIEPTDVPLGVDVGPALDPSALELPEVGVAVQLDTTEVVVLVSIDGTVLGHLDGFSLPGHPLPGGGPLVLRRGDDVVQLDDGRLAPVDGLPLADGAFLVESGALRLADGTEVALAAGMRWVSVDRDWVSVVVYDDERAAYGVGAAYSTADGSSISLAPQCAVTDVTADGALVQVCDDDVLIGEKVVRDGGPFAGSDAGHWTSAVLSPGVNEVLLQHSGECESQTGWRTPTGEGTFRALGPTGEAWDGAGLGWLEDGRVVVSFGSGICGAAFPDGPGVYVEERDGTVSLLHPMPPGVTYMGAMLWRQASA